MLSTASATVARWSIGSVFLGMCVLSQTHVSLAKEVVGVDDLHGIRFIAYTPSAFDPCPERRRLPDAHEIRADLETLRPYFDGLLLYGSYEPAGEILRVAADLRFRGIILGVWDVRDEDERRVACSLVARYPELVKAVCIGNEGLTFGRYTHEALADAFAWMRQRLPHLPLTTSEPVSQYGDTALQALPDFHAPNIHPVFDHGSNDVASAVAWVIERTDAIREVTGKTVLCKETGWPSAGGERFTPEAQRLFWTLLYSHVGRRPETKVGFVGFEAFDLPWKAHATGIACEEHWGLWTADRQPKSVVGALKKVE